MPIALFAGWFIAASFLKRKIDSNHRANSINIIFICIYYKNLIIHTIWVFIWFTYVNMCKVNRLTYCRHRIDHDHEPVGDSNGIIFDSMTKIRYYNDMKSVLFIICLSALLLTGGCAELQGKSVKTYQLQYNDAVQASTDALEDLEISILNVEADELRTDILARRGDGTPVTVEVKRVDRNFTRVAVGTGTGVDRYLSKDVLAQIHEFIRKQMVRPSKGIVEWPES